MPFTVFKDFDKSTADIIDEDFDTKYTLKVKSAGPSGSTLTSTTTLDTAKDVKLSPKLSLKWPHPSGFTLEKFESASNGKLAIETSLTGAAPGLKLEFKGNDSDKGDLGFTYTAPAATVTGEVDLLNFSSVKASAIGGTGPITAGGNTEVKLSKAGIDSYCFGLGLGYTLPKVFFLGVRADKNLSAYSALFSYSAVKDITLAGKLTYNQKDKLGAVVASVYRCNPDTTIKVKASSGGVFAASVKHTFPGKFAVVGSTEIPAQLNAAKFGINATLG